MKTIEVTVFAFVLSLTSLYLIANRIEGGDVNAILMYFVVFLIPIIILIVLNSYFIRYLTKIQNKVLKFALSFIPLIILFILSQMKGVTTSFFDGDLTLVGTVGSISIGAANFFWALVSLKLNSSQQ